MLLCGRSLFDSVLESLLHDRPRDGHQKAWFRENSWMINIPLKLIYYRSSLSVLLFFKLLSLVLGSEPNLVVENLEKPVSRLRT
jgi:hypothetical protein